MGFFSKLRGGTGQPMQPAQRRQFPTNGSARPTPSRVYEKDSQGFNKMPSIESLGTPKSGSVYHSTPQGSTSPLRHEVTSYGDMHTVHTYGMTAKGTQKLSAFMTDRAPRFENNMLSFGGGNTFDMGTGKQAPSGAAWKNAKMTSEWKPQ